MAVATGKDWRMQPVRDRLHRLGLRARVTLVFAALAFLLSVSLAIFSYELTRSFLISRRADTVRQQAYLNASAVRDALEANPLDVRGALTQTQAGADSAIVVRVGREWFGTSVGVGRKNVPSSLRKLVAGGSAGTQNIRISSVPNIGVGVPLAAVRGSYFEFVPVDDLDSTLGVLARALAAAAIVITAVGAVVGRYASGRVLRPVQRMAATAAGIGEGALDERLDAEGDSDLEPLVDAFNAMVAALRTRIEREAQFASDVSHELRTPLATMAAALNVARRRKSGEAADDALAVLDAEVQRFNRLVVDLLEISRLEAGASELQLESVEPRALVQEVLTSTQRTGVRVEEDASAPGRAVIDSRRISQVLTNLLDNADAYGNGATAVGIAGTADTLLLAVDDEGPGIPAHERAYVFERFARGESAGSAPGTGLGLALVVEHVRLHHGAVWVEDAPTGGARFVVAIPRDLS
jgi:two-component system, OmpR family, sensor histidine kinase MtrB